MAKKRKVTKKKISEADLVKELPSVDFEFVHTQCSFCNLRLVILKVDATRCILCGGTELITTPFFGGSSG